MGESWKEYAFPGSDNVSAVYLSGRLYDVIELATDVGDSQSNLGAEAKPEGVYADTPSCYR